MSRPRHPSKEIEAVVADAEARGWRFRAMGHWGRMFCPQTERDGCQVGVNSTPRSAEVHARQIARAIERCPHKMEADNENA